MSYKKDIIVILIFANTIITFYNLPPPPLPKRKLPYMQNNVLYGLQYKSPESNFRLNCNLFMSN